MSSCTIPNFNSMKVITRDSKAGTKSNTDVAIIAGPCSVDSKNIHEIYEIASMQVPDAHGVMKKAIFGTRVVGLKSRTSLSSDGSGMGMDYATYKRNLKALMSGKSVDTLTLSPSAKLSIEIFEKTNLLIATEVCSPLIQLAPLSGKIPKNKLLPWNPAVNQLGWPLHEIAAIANINDWYIGIKNGKWLGTTASIAESKHLSEKTPLEIVWTGLETYASLPKNKTFFIQRGVEVPFKGNYRSLPIHETAKRVKKVTGCRMLFDPSHSLGPKLRDHIVAATIDAMHIKTDEGGYLYDGALIEAGTSTTDTLQHITLQELYDCVHAISAFRNILSP